MKKILLSAAAIFAAMSLNAQVVETINADNALGLAEDGSPLTAGTVLWEGEQGTLTVGADDTYKKQGIKANVNGVDINGGLQGGANPKDEDGGTCATTLKAPVSGAFFTFAAKTNGYLYVIHKASSNKAYTVFEEGAPIGYTFAAVAGDGSSILGATYKFTLKGEGEYNNLVNPVDWAEQEYLKQADPAAYEANFTVADDGTKSWNKIGMSGVGVIVFPVFADCKYNFNANGSKMSLAGFAFSTEDNLVVKDGDVVVYDPTGSEPQPGAEEKELELTEGHTLLISTIEAAGGTDEDIVRFYITNTSADSREGWGIGGFANSDNWTPTVEWTGMAGSEWTYEYTVAQIKATAGDAPGQYHGIGITINIYNDCKVAKATLVKKGASGIKNAKIETVNNGAIFNLAGQQVDSNFKGLVIKNGKKMIQK